MASSPSCSSTDFNTNAFGPVAWHHLHTVGFSFPEDPSPAQKEDFARFLVYFTRTLPCSDCRANFEKYIAASFKPDTHLRSCEALSRWIFRAHNHVNAKLGKRVWPEEKFAVVRRYYTKLRDPEARASIKLVL